MSKRAVIEDKFVTSSLRLALGCDLFSPRRHGDHGFVTYIFASAWVASAVQQPRRMTWVAVVPLLTWRSQGSRQSRQ